MLCPITSIKCRLTNDLTKWQDKRCVPSSVAQSIIHSNTSKEIEIDYHQLILIRINNPTKCEYPLLDHYINHLNFRKNIIGLKINSWYLREMSPILMAIKINSYLEVKKGEYTRLIMTSVINSHLCLIHINRLLMNKWLWCKNVFLENNFH